MKIGLVSPYDWSYPGGVRDHVRHLADEFIAAGHDVRILAPASGKKGKLFEPNVYKMGGTTPIPINGSIARITLNPVLGRHVRRVLQRERFDVIHLHEPLLPGLSLTVLRFSRTLNVGTFHAFARPGMASTPYLAYASAYPFLRHYFRRLAGRIAVSPAAYSFVSRYFDGDYRIIPNGVNLDSFSPTILPFPQYMDGKRNILFVGRFERRKGAKFLLRAIPTIRERFPDTRFIFVGEGRLRPGFQQFVERHGWQDVIFTGYVPDEDKQRYFASAHVFCAPAIGGESMGVVLLEAMAAGKPVVATDIEGYATVVHDGVDGLLVPPRDSEALAFSIARLLENESLRQRLIHNGLETACNYAWPQVARRILDYYAELLEERAVYDTARNARNTFQSY
ncbi:MAG TPA: glycosyltransferase family 4 protein [Ktedonobacteraceae bacterium]|nr:glycosyltransferase family 4 protein [Ktedonobacteraceae bacterium]